MAPKLAHSSFALDLLRRLLCAHSTGDAAGIARQRGDGAPVVRCPAQEEEPGAEARSPCIVARLMGLDAMPTAARDQQQPLRRSLSASSAEGWLPPCCHEDAPRPRAIVRASASFRERPTYLRLENDEFLLLSFSPDGSDDDDDKAGLLLASRSDDDADDGTEIAGRRGRRRDGRAKKQRRARRRPQRRCVDEEAESAPGRSRECAGECGLQTSSPVSVLEARDVHEESSTATSTTSSFSMDGVERAEPCSPSSGEIQPAYRLQQQGSRRKLLQSDLDDLRGGLPPVAASTCGVSKGSDSERSHRRGADNAAEVIIPDASATGIWQLICRLVEEDIGGMKWEARDDANIAAEMESEILDQIIYEEICELIQLIKV